MWRAYVLKAPEFYSMGDDAEEVRAYLLRSMLLLERSASAMCSAQASGAVRSSNGFFGKGPTRGWSSWKSSRASGCRIWDGSVLEKAESEKVQGLCAVRSSKAKRLRKLKPGLSISSVGLQSW